MHSIVNLMVVHMQGQEKYDAFLSPAQQMPLIRRSTRTLKVQPNHQQAE
jgi:hypothetical protein